MLVVLTTVNAVNWADRQVVPILFPAIRGELGLTDTQLGVVGGLAFSAVYAVSAFVFGRAADRSIRRNLVIVGLIVWSAATAAGGLAGGFGSLFAARFFTGVGEASLYPCAISLIAERFPARARGRAMGIFGAAAAVGSGVGIGLGGHLAATIGWRSVFFSYGAAGIVLLPALFLLREPRRPPSPEHEAPVAGVIAGFLRDKRLLAVYTSGCIMIASGIGYGAWVPSYFVRERGLSVAQAGYLFGAASLIGGILGSVLGGVFADRRRRVRNAGEMDVSAFTALAAAPLVWLTLAVDSWPVFVATGILAPVAIFAFFPSLQTILADLVSPRNLGLAFAVQILFLGGVGTAAGPAILGFVSDRAGSLVVAMYVPVLGFLIAAGLAVFSGRVVRAYDLGAGGVCPAAEDG